MIIYELTRHWREAWEGGWDSLGLFLHKEYITPKFEYLQNRSKRINQYKRGLEQLHCEQEIYSSVSDKGWDRIRRYEARCEKLMRKTDPDYHCYEVSYYLNEREVDDSEPGGVTIPAGSSL